MRWNGNRLRAQSVKPCWWVLCNRSLRDMITERASTTSNSNVWNEHISLEKQLRYRHQQNAANWSVEFTNFTIVTSNTLKLYEYMSQCQTYDCNLINILHRTFVAMTSATAFCAKLLVPLMSSTVNKGEHLLLSPSGVLCEPHTLWHTYFRRNNISASFSVTASLPSFTWNTQLWIKFWFMPKT